VRQRIIFRAEISQDATLVARHGAYHPKNRLSAARGIRWRTVAAEVRACAGAGRLHAALIPNPADGARCGLLSKPGTTRRVNAPCGGKCYLYVSVGRARVEVGLDRMSGHFVHLIARGLGKRNRARPETRVRNLGFVLINGPRHDCGIYANFRRRGMPAPLALL
jgi:hypothetical protein